MADHPPYIRIRRSWLRIAFVVAATAAVVAPIAVVAADRFSDVPDTNTFHDDINAIADVGVTLGCNPPANDQYCPSDFVTREQMAAFMNRLGALSPGKTPVVNADMVDGKHASDFAAAADNRFIALSPYEAFVEDATLSDGFGRFSGIDLPNASTPSVAWGFTLPPDFPTGGTVTVELLWHTDSTGCGIEFRPNSISVGRAARTHIQGSGASTGLSVVGGNTLSAPATANQSSIVELVIVSPDGATDLEAGDSVIFGMFRSDLSAADTCTGDMTIQAGSVTY